MNIDKIKVPAGWACVRYDNSNEFFKLGGSEFLLDISYEPEKNAQTSGIVVKICDNLIFSQNNSNSHPYDVDIEVKKGDRVIFHFLTILQAKKEGKTFVQDGELYVFMPYERMFVGISGDKVTPLNGYVLVEPVEQTLPDTALIIPDTARGLSKTHGIVKYAGAKCRGYAGHLKHMGEDPDVNVGDMVVFNQVEAIPLQYEHHSILERNLYRMQRKDILAILTAF
ncbi:MAG TPA: hypothetical protein PLU58_06565 [Saprospiraceae bacterium]|nr:hypothetical protein [Saprospiraceae bacterium]